MWLATDTGVAVLDRRGHAIGSLTAADGLISNRITSGTALGGRIYFSSTWGDEGGGLIEIDPSVGALTSFVASDGLASNHIARVEPTAEGLRVFYEVEEEHSSNRRYFPPSTFDPVTHVAGKTDAAIVLAPWEDVRRVQRELFGEQKKPLPFLGGVVTHSATIGGLTYLCGTHGAVVFDGAEMPARSFDEIKVSYEEDPEVVWAREAEVARRTLDVARPATLESYVHHANPYMRLAALECAGSAIEDGARALVPVLRAYVRDPFPQVRAMAAEILGKSSDVSVADSLQPLLADTDADVRDAAALALARLGRPASVAVYEQLLAKRDDGSKREEVFGALAVAAGPDTFALLLRYPIDTDKDSDLLKIYQELGRAVRRDPRSIDALLAARAVGRDPGPDSSDTTATRFAQDVLKHAGPSILPRVHRSLQSPDRVIRSNAARACGAIGDRSSIAHLLAALDLESGLSRSSIVWALGQLKAVEALPRLAEMYSDVAADDPSGPGTGFLGANAASEYATGVEAIHSLAQLTDEWERIKYKSTPRPTSPRTDEPLLSRETIRDAVASIGAAQAQGFYRRLAGGRDSDARAEAARHLAEGVAADRAANLPVLRALSVDADGHVAGAAIVSLLILGDDEVQGRILALLAEPPSWENRILWELQHVADGRRLALARSALERIVAGPDSRAGEDAHRLLGQIPKE